jgi:hypothetical protein
MNKRNELLHHIHTAMKEAGAVVIDIQTTGSGHRVAVFEVGGQRGRYFFATSPRQGKDLKAIASARRTVRATLGGRGRAS